MMKIRNWVKVSLMSFPLLFIMIGCSQEIRSRYTLKNILIGAAIGLAVGILAKLIAGSGKSGK
jgi:hypothetical protein